MIWKEVYHWMESKDHVNSAWECIGATDSSFYAEDEFENTFISMFTRNDGELIVYVGMMRPKISVGGSTGIIVNSHYDVIDYLEDNLENMYDELMEKARSCV